MEKKLQEETRSTLQQTDHVHIADLRISKFLKKENSGVRSVMKHLASNYHKLFKRIQAGRNI